MTLAKDVLDYRTVTEKLYSFKIVGTIRINISDLNTANAHNHSAVSLWLMTVEAMDKILIVSWSNSPIEGVITFCRIFGKYVAAALE